MTKAIESVEEMQEMFGLDPDELEIDFSQLDVEWGRQDFLLKKYIKAAAFAEKIVRKAEEKVKFIRSTLILNVTDDPQGCIGQAKTTAQTTEAYYRTQEEYILTKEELINAMYIRDLVIGEKSRCYGRKTILEEATKLSLAGWFAAPLIPRELKELVNKIEEQKIQEVDKKIREKSDEKKENKPLSRRRKKNV